MFFTCFIFHIFSKKSFLFISSFHFFDFSHLFSMKFQLSILSFILLLLLSPLFLFSPLCGVPRTDAQIDFSQQHHFKIKRVFAPPFFRFLSLVFPFPIFSNVFHVWGFLFSFGFTYEQFVFRWVIFHVSIFLCFRSIFHFFI